MPSAMRMCSGKSPTMSIIFKGCSTSTRRRMPECWPRTISFRGLAPMSSSSVSLVIGSSTPRSLTPTRSAVASTDLSAALGIRASSWKPRRPKSPGTSRSSFPRSAGSRRAWPTTTTWRISPVSITTFGRLRPSRAVSTPDSYGASQALAETLLETGSSGIVYPSVRRKGGVCLACFRPALVGNVRQRARYRFTWAGTPAPTISLDETFT